MMLTLTVSTILPLDPTFVDVEQVTRVMAMYANSSVSIQEMSVVTEFIDNSD